jgi:hypothetical protein
LRQAGVLTAALNARAVRNQVVKEPTIAAQTDWSLSMPAKRYSVAADYAATGTARRRFSIVPPSGQQYFHDGNTSIVGLCTQVAPFTADREGLMTDYSAVFTGSYQVVLCGVVSVLRWLPYDPTAGIFSKDSADGPLGDAVRRIPSPNGFAHNGWAQLDPLNGGLPLLGYSFIQAFNPAAQPGVSGNYGIVFEHLRLK